MRVAAVIVTLAAVVAGPAVAQPLVFVETAGTSTLPAALAELLAEELGAGAVASGASGPREPARLLVRLTRRDAPALRLEARSIRRGVVILERDLDLAGGVNPALRVAVLLVRSALDAELAVLDSERARPPPVPQPSSSFGLTVVPVVTLASWADPLLPPQVGFGAHVEGRFGGPLYVLLSASAAGHACCSRSTADVEADIAELVLAGGAGLSSGSGALSYGAEAAVGLDVLSGETRGVGFAGPATPAEVSGVDVIVLAAGWVGVTIAGDVAVRVRAGVRISFIAPSFTAPVAGAPVETGFAAPFAGFGVVVPVL